MEVCPGFSVSGFGFRVYLDGFAHAHLIGQNAALVLGALLLAKKKGQRHKQKKRKEMIPKKNEASNLLRHSRQTVALEGQQMPAKSRC